MARIRKHRNKWQVLYRDPATKKERSAGVFDRKSDANKVKLSIERAMATRKWIPPEHGETTLRDWAALWQSTTTTLARKTVSDYDSLLRTWILPHFGDIALSEITAMSIRQWTADMEQRNLSASRRRKALMLLKQILNTAVDDRRIPSNPATNVKGPKVRYQKRPYLLPHELQALAAEVQERYRALILVMGVAGLRFGEAAALQRGDIDVLHGSLNVSKSVSESHLVGHGGRVEIKLPKNGKVRSVRIPRFLSSVLNDHLQAYTPADPGAIVFPATNGSLLRATNFCPRILRPALVAAGLNTAITAHDLRHSAAAAMITVNPNPQLITEQLGHGSISTTFNFYGHLFPSESDKLADALETQWNSAGNGPGADRETLNTSEIGA